MLHWLTLLALLVGNSLALGLYDDIDDYHLWQRGGPSVATTASPDKECIKDILVLWDNSNSIGTDGFRDKVVPFLKKFINSTELKVGRDGTNVGFITFSSEAHTKSLLKIGNKTEPDELDTWLDGLDYRNRLSGMSTYMGKAFKLANDEFSKENPLNHRAEFADVILLFTDGNPQGYRGNRKKTQEQKDMALDYSALLRDRGVKIIGMAVETLRGKPTETFIAELSTDGKVISATLDNLDTVLKELVNETCGKVGQGCQCDGIIEVNSFVGPKEQTTALTWPKPTPDCKLVKEPEQQPGSSQFPVDETPLDYIFETEEGKQLACRVKINVGRCSCPHTETIRRMVQPGRTKVDVNWAKPEPNCPVTSNPNNPGTSGSFGVGEHTMRYNFMYSGGERDPFALECQVNIIVDGYCGENVYDTAEQECCCGKIRKKIPGHRCCGSRYYNPITQDCCDESTGIILKYGNCP